MTSLFVCPLCGAALTRDERAYRCPAGHSFDIAREGYTHLLPANRKHSKAPGDDKAMTAARSAFLNKGYYEFLRDALCDIALTYTRHVPAVLDVGCGEGYYTKAVADVLPLSSVFGTDISKDELTVAAKRAKNVDFAVASSFSLPFADSSIDILLEIFSPYCGDEFKRVLKKDAVFIRCIICGAL